jgi:hypothetical protein
MSDGRLESYIYDKRGKIVSAIPEDKDSLNVSSEKETFDENGRLTELYNNDGASEFRSSYRCHVYDEYGNWSYKIIRFTEKTPLTDTSTIYIMERKIVYY